MKGYAWTKPEQIIHVYIQFSAHFETVHYKTKVNIMHAIENSMKISGHNNYYNYNHPLSKKQLGSCLHYAKQATPKKNSLLFIAECAEGFHSGLLENSCVLNSPTLC